MIYIFNIFLCLFLLIKLNELVIICSKLLLATLCRTSRGRSHGFEFKTAETCEFLRIFEFGNLWH